MSWKNEFWKSIKGFDTEEKLDLYFYRPFGFLFAKIALHTGISPTQLTIAGMLLGVSSGYFFIQNENSQALAIGSILFIIAGVLDSADGQLARMGGKSTRIGIVLDGLCDNLVFATVYISSTLTIVPQWGWKIWPIAVFAGVCHSLQSSILDFYNREYLYFGYGKTDGGYWNDTLEEATRDRANANTREEKFFWSLRFSWVWQQNKFCGRKLSDRLYWKTLVLGKNSEAFQAEYRNQNRTILRFWRLMGPNFHTILILIFVFLRRFDLYLILADIILLTCALLILRSVQQHKDSALMLLLEARGIK